MMNVEMVPTARRSRPLHAVRASTLVAPVDGPRFAHVVFARDSLLFGYDVTFAARQPGQPRRSLGPRVIEAAAAVPGSAQVLLHLAPECAATDIAALSTDLEAAGLRPGRFVLVFPRAMRLFPRLLEDLTQVARALGFGWSHEVAERVLAAQSMRWWQLELGGNERGPTLRMATGVETYRDLAAAVAASVDVVHGRVLGAPAPAPAPLRFTRRALVRAAGRRTYPLFL